jgi:hemolysin III
VNGGATPSLLSILGCQPVSSFSHLIAAGFAFSAAVPLVRLGRGCSIRMLALSIYVSCVIAALAISGTYHSFNYGGAARIFWQRIDHYAIWALIAGTFTAVHGTMYKGFWRTGILAITWGYAAIGILLQVLWFDTFSGNLGLALYLGLGWMGLASIIKLGRQLGFAAVMPFFYSGIFFSVGAILEANKWPTLITNWVGAHEIFHFAVIVGVSLNWLFVRKLMLHHVRTQPLPELAMAAAAGAPVSSEKPAA